VIRFGPHLHWWLYPSFSRRRYVVMTVSPRWSFWLGE
jgi:hypothetical protein